MPSGYVYLNRVNAYWVSRLSKEWHLSKSATINMLISHGLERLAELGMINAFELEESKAAFSLGVKR